MNIINIEHISKIFGGKVIFDDVSCGISEGEKIGVIGINGTGKTTLLRVLAGLEQPDEGQVITQNGIRIAYLQQNPAFPEEKTVLSYVTDGMWDMDWTLQSEAKSMLNQLAFWIMSSCWQSFPVVRGERQHLYGHWCRILMYCCWTSRPTIWIMRCSHGWKTI